MKSIITLSIASLIIILMAFQQPKPEKQDLPRDYSVYPNDSVFRVDSLRNEKMIERFWEYIDSREIDSLKMIIDKIIILSDKLNRYRDDSLTYVTKWGMYSEKGAVLAWEGKPYEGLKYLTESIDTAINRFGPYYERLAEGYVVTGSVFRQVGDYDKAIEYIHKSLVVTRKTRGEKHYYIGHNFTNLAIRLIFPFG